MEMEKLYHNAQHIKKADHLQGFIVFHALVSIEFSTVSILYSIV